MVPALRLAPLTPDVEKMGDADAVGRSDLASLAQECADGTPQISEVSHGIERASRLQEETALGEPTPSYDGPIQDAR
jgi:hypothetical protein